MKRQALTLLAIFFAVYTSFAQDLYRNGYIITNNNDTVPGLINDKETARSPISIEFKENENAAPKTYTWNEIKGYATSRGVIFESHHFQYDSDAPSKGGFVAADLPDGYYPSRLPEKLITTDCFLEVIVNGKFSLYKYHDANDRIHFLILDDDKTELEELLYRPFRPSGSPTLSVNESYKQQLLLRSSRCSSLKSKISSAPYREKNLARIVTAMNECYGSVQKTIRITESKDQKRPAFGIVAEGYVTDPSFLIASGGYSGLQFGGGISYEIFSKRRPNRVSFYNELKFKNFAGDDKYRGKHSSFTATGNLAYQTVKLTNMARIYPGPIFINAGAVYGYRFNTSIDDQTLTDRDAADRFEFGFAAGLGKKFRSIGLSIESRFEINIPNGQKSFALVICKQLF